MRAHIEKGSQNANNNANGSDSRAEGIDPEGQRSIFLYPVSALLYANVTPLD